MSAMSSTFGERLNHKLLVLMKFVFLCGSTWRRFTLKPVSDVPRHLRQHVEEGDEEICERQMHDEEMHPTRFLPPIAATNDKKTRSETFQLLCLRKCAPKLSICCSLCLVTFFVGHV